MDPLLITDMTFSSFNPALLVQLADVVPVVYLDCTGRPEVADLVRVCTTEGAGDDRVRSANPGEYDALLEVDFISPVTVRFGVLFRHSETQDMAALAFLRSAGQIGIAVAGQGRVNRPDKALLLDATMGG
jgi:hypothetical protein